MSTRAGRHLVQEGDGSFITIPGDVRDAAATTWAVAAPEHIGIACDLLMHSDLRTTYNQARGIEAGRAYAQMVEGRRRESLRR